MNQQIDIGYGNRTFNTNPEFSDSPFIVEEIKSTWWLRYICKSCILKLFDSFWNIEFGKMFYVKIDVVLLDLLVHEDLDPVHWIILWPSEYLSTGQMLEQLSRISESSFQWLLSNLTTFSIQWFEIKLWKLWNVLL